MRGTPHEVSVLDQVWDDSVPSATNSNGSWVPVPPYVHLTNVDDLEYRQHFENWKELNEFIARLKTAGYRAFGPDNG